MSQFRVNRDGIYFGPYEEAQARAKFAQGNIFPTDLVWREGMASWLPASQVFGDMAGAGTRPAAPPLPPAFGAPPGVGFTSPTASYAAGASTSALPLPPKLHWALVLLFSVLTLGIFFVVWMFIQVSWIRRIDSKSNATMLFVIYVVLTTLGQFALASGGGKLGGLLDIGSLVAFMMGAFSVRRSMQVYFNTVEPIGLELSSAMTVLFNVLYFQHHMTRIALWKTSGVLTPQS